MRVPDIVPCVCVDHKPDVSDSVYGEQKEP